MNIDKEYLIGLLKAIQSSSNPFTDIKKLKLKGYDYKDKKFIYHILMLEEKNLIQSDGNGIGYQRPTVGEETWTVKDLRLTALGHDFIDNNEKK